LKRLLLLFIFLKFSFSLDAQVEDYDISEFETPDYVFKSLLIVPDVSFLTRNYEDFQNGKTIFDLGTSLDFNGFRYTRNRIGNTSARLTLNYDYDKYDDHSKHVLVFPNVSLSTEQYFYQEEKRFFKLDGRLYGFIVSNFGEPNSPNTAYVDQRDLSLSASPKFGVGRYEIVNNAWHTRQILDILNKEGLLLKDPTHSEITELAEEITKLKNQRVIDFRFDRIFEYEQVVGEFISRGLVDPTDYRFFALFQDAWRYELFIQRRHGSTFALGPRSEVNYDWREGISKSYGVEQWHALELAYEKYHAMGPWQLDGTISADGGYYTYDETDIGPSGNEFKSELDWKYLRLNANASLGHFLNSRTFWNVSLSAFRIQYFDDDRNYLRANLSGQFRYFVSPRLRYSLYGNIGLLGWSTDDTRDRDASVSLRMDYYFY